MKRFLRVVTLLTLLSSVAFRAWASPVITISETHTNLVCNGRNDGSIQILPSGGVAPYTYYWGGTDTSQNQSNLAAGSYTVLVTDQNGATASATINITQPSPYFITKSITNENCGGQHMGAIVLHVTGNTPAYSYHWNTSDTTSSLSNLTAAVYYVTITDANGCSATDSCNVTQPPGVAINMTISAVSCSAGMSNGAIAVSVQYGNPGYQYLWNDGATTQNRTGLTMGNYMLTVTDAIGCTAIDTGNVGDLPGSMSINAVEVNPTCYHGGNGTITITSVVGSTAPYTYVWSDAVTTQNRTGLAAGNYAVTATSSSGCTTSSAFTIGQPNQISVTPHLVEPTCFQNSNGAISVTSNGGNSPYSYLWSNGGFTSSIFGLAVGTYTVTVTDFKGCTVTSTSTLTAPQVLVTATPTQINCSGGPTGSIITNTTGGTSPYSYWWGAGVVSANRSNIGSGNYTVTVTDAHGCTATANAVIAAYSPMTLTSDVQNALCYDDSNGFIAITVANGQGPFNYAWNDLESTSEIDFLAAGTYSVTVTDSKSCTATATNTITAPPFSITVNSTINDVSCFGMSNGSIALNPLNGSPPYNYKWNGNQTSPNISNLATGTYFVTITDNNGCRAVSSFTVTQPLLITPVATPFSATCFGTGTGAINLAVTGGYSPFSYSWNDGVATQSRTNLHAGTYSVTITDNHNCTATSAAIVNQPALLTIGETSVNPACAGGSNGAITITAAGGISPYNFNWGSGITTQNRSSLSAGTYAVTETDANGCSTSVSASLVAPSPISISSSTTNVACNGGNTGIITLTVGGGTAPYTYDWGSGITAQNRTSLVAGTYTVTVTDNAGCSATASATISGATNLALTTSITNVTCFGMSNGAVLATATGGTLPYAFSWTNGNTTNQRSNLAAGTYAVTVTDHVGCSASASFDVTQPASLTISTATVNPACAAGSNGSITVTTGGGTTPYQYNWGNGVTTQNRNGLSSGNYVVTETDANGCSISASATLLAPAPITISSTTTNVACNGGNTGTINLTLNGGTSPYTYNWGSGFTTQNRANLTAGNYSVTVNDNVGCSAIASVVISGATNLALSTIVTNVTCFGMSNGSIAATATGGTTPYAFSWGNGNTTSQRSNLAAGNYVVSVTDHAGCSTSILSTVTQPPLLSVSSSSTAVSCNGSAGGAISISVNGGASPYTYSWNSGATTQNRSNLTAGTYYLTVTDNAGCTLTNSSTVTQPPALIVSNTASNVLCNGTANGSIQTTVSGGTGAYNYNWGGGVVTANRTGLAAGTYYLTVNDANSCSATSTIVITQPTAVSATALANNVNCFGQSTGGVNLTVTGGTGAYTYHWAGGQSTQNLSAQGPGTYNVTVLDANSCSATASAIITQPTQIATSINSINNASCYGASNGGINIQINGGTPTYSYVWSNGSTQQNLSGVIAGTYRVSVSDAHGCTASTSINVSQPNQITFTSSVTNVACFGDNTGSVLTSVSGGNGAFNYTWSNGANTPNISYLTAGNYTVSVHDIMNCTASFSVQVSQPPLLTLVTTQTNVVCNGGNTGSATANVSGGAGSYSYNWSNGQTTSQITQLGQGLVHITVTDANTCSATATVNISQINSIGLSLNAINVACNGQANGSATAVVNGGALPYQYLWSNNATTSSVSNLSAGIYAVTVTDANHCNTSATANINQPAAITISPSVVNLSCFGSANGSIQTAASGGTGNLQYLWSNNANTAGINNITAGNYSVTVTDAHACSATAGITVTQPTQISVALTKVNATCYGSNSGSITSTVSGGTGTYTYIWSNAATSANITSLTQGNYAVTVTDSAGCSVSAATNITQPTAVNVSTNAVNVLCNGNNTGSAGVQVSGGSGTYTFNWSNHATTQQIAQLVAGAYSVTVTDANACSATASANVTQLAALTVATTQSNYACANKEGLINVSTTGGNAPYTYVWQDGSTLQSRSQLTAGTYAVTVSDQNHCSKSAIVVINQLAPMITTITPTPVTCFNGTNGTISVVVTGGTQPLTYSWNNSATATHIQNLPAGNYNVIITDLYGCTASAAGSINQPAAMQLSAQLRQPLCSGQNNGAISVSVSGGTAPYSYSWNNATTADSLVNIAAGNYSLTITDGNGCVTASNAITLNQPEALRVNTIITPVGCSGLNDGSVAAEVAGGTPPYSYNWSTSAKTVQIDSLAPGNYTLTVSDNNGCLTNRLMAVAAATPITLSAVAQNTSCSTVENGSISVTVSGGSLPYLYRWNNGQSAPTLNDIAAGYYTVTVTDNKGCSAETGDSILVNYALTVHASAATSNGQIQLSAATNVDHSNTYSWNPSNVLSCSNCASTVAQPQQSTLFTINVTDVNGCKASDTVSVEVSNATTDVFIPNAFTPNGDGVNDEFKIFGDLAGVHFIDLAIFDKWGEKVFESNNPNFEWDGTYRGQAAPLGVYVYTATIVFDNGKSKDYKGSVTLLR